MINLITVGNWQPDVCYCFSLVNAPTRSYKNGVRQVLYVIQYTCFILYKGVLVPNMDGGKRNVYKPPGLHSSTKGDDSAYSSTVQSGSGALYQRLKFVWWWYLRNEYEYEYEFEFKFKFQYDVQHVYAVLKFCFCYAFTLYLWLMRT